LVPRWVGEGSKSAKNQTDPRSPVPITPKRKRDRRGAHSKLIWPPRPAKIIEAGDFGGLTSGIKQVVLYLLWIGGQCRRDRWWRCCSRRRLCRRRRSDPSQHPARWAVFRLCDGGIVVGFDIGPHAPYMIVQV